MRGGPRLFSTAGPLERSASWSLREPSVFDVGAGPTVATALEVSKRPEDLRLVTAAWRNELEKVEEVLGEADLEAHVRLPGPDWGWCLCVKKEKTELVQSIAICINTSFKIT